MNCCNIIKRELNMYQENEIIFASKFYKERLQQISISETAFYKSLERMHKNKIIYKLGKGIYYFPKFSKFGCVPISKNEIINLYTKNNSGMIIGYDLYNKLNLSTQVSKKTTIYSSFIDNETKKILNIEIKNIKFNLTNEYIKIIEMLEVLQHFQVIEDINYRSFYNYAKNFASTYNEENVLFILNSITYKKCTISFLHTILNHFNVKNNLNFLLSTLSKYNHMNMETIYELTLTQ